MHFLFFVPLIFFCFSFLSQGPIEEDRDHSLVDPDLTLGVPKASVQLQMDENHLVDLSNLQSSMALSFKEELKQVNLCLIPFLRFLKSAVNSMP